MYISYYKSPFLQSILVHLRLNGKRPKTLEEGFVLDILYMEETEMLRSGI